MESELLNDALGPFWSNSGTKSWSLLLGTDRIIAWPYSFGESLKLGLRFNLGAWVRDPGEDFRAVVRQGLAASDLPRTRQIRTYHAHLLRGIIARSNSTANTITFEKLSGEKDEYAVAVRQETDIYRQVLGARYPAVYQEKDFPTSALGKLLRK
jgi:hypothetical protein